jgi:O-antigen ligase
MLLAVCSWLLMLTCFTLPGRFGPETADALDGIALLKLSVRLGTLAVLSLVLLRSRHLPHGGEVLFGLAPLGLFVAWSLLSTAWSPLKSVSLGQSVGLAVLFVIALTTGRACRDETNTRFLLKQLETGLLVFSGLIVLANRVLPQLGSLDRMDPGLIHPTAAASAASLGLVLLVACRLLWGWRWTRVQLVPGVAIYVSLLVLAANRTTLPLTAGILGTLAIWFGGRRLAGITLLAAGVLTTVYVLYDPGWQLAESASAVAVERATRGELEGLHSISGRTDMWVAIWDHYQESPWIGHGYFVTSPRGEFFMWGLWANWTAHSVPLQALVSTGLVGAVLLALGLGLPFARAWTQRSHSPWNTRLWYLILLLGAWYFVWGLFNESWLGSIQPESVVFFIVLGLAAGTTHRRSAHAGSASETEAAACVQQIPHRMALG